MSAAASIDVGSATTSNSCMSLNCGNLRFTAYAIGTGPLVLLLHGFPDTPHTFHRQLPALAAAGYRAVAVTLRGYQPSSQPADGSYHVRNLAQDVLDWMTALGEQKAHLVGHDWGASIAYAAAALKPSAFHSLTTLAVPHPRRFAEVYREDRIQRKRSSYLVWFQLRGLAEFWIGRNNSAYLEKLWQRWSPGWCYGNEQIGAMKAHFSAPGVKRAALTYYRQAIDVKSTIGRASGALFAVPITVPTLGITGSRDGCIAADVFERAMRSGDFPAGLQVIRIEGAGHFVHQEAVDQVNKALLQFVAANRAS